MARERLGDTRHAKRARDDDQLELDEIQQLLTGEAVGADGKFGCASVYHAHAVAPPVRARYHDGAQELS